MTRHNVEFGHAIYEQQGHVSGAYPPEREEHYTKIRSLLKGADAALYRQPGYFFDTLDTDPPTFVFGFLVESEARKGEVFFDIYLAPVDEVSGVSLTDLKAQLERRSEDVDTRHDPISERVTVDLANATRHGETSTSRDQTRTERGEPTPDDDSVGPADGGSHWESVDSDDGWGSGSGGDWGSDPHDTGSTDPGEDELYATPMSMAEVAALWERYRSGDDPAAVDLVEVNRFVATVDGSLPEVDFVSHVPDGGDPRYFSFAGWAREAAADPTELRAWLDANVTVADLDWDDLPTYEDELRRLRSSMIEDLGGVGEYDRISERIAANLATAIEETLATHHRDRATEVFRSAVDGSLDVDDGGALDGFRNIVGSDPDKRYEAIADGIATDTVDDELKSAIADELGESIRADLQERVDSEIVPALAERLDTAVEDQVEVVLKRTIEHVDEYKGSKPYAESKADAE